MKPEFRIFLRKTCVINPELAAGESSALLGLFLPKLIEVAVGGIATALKKAGAANTEQIAASEVTDLYVTGSEGQLSINPDLGCIIGVYGVFSDQDGSPTPGDDHAVKALVNAKLVPKNADVAIVFEAAIVPTVDRTAFYLELRHFSVREFLAGRRGERTYIATLAVTTPNATADGATIALGNIALGRMEREALPIPEGGPFGVYPRYRSNLMPWNRITGDAKDAYEADARAGKVKPAYMPVTLTLTLSETEDGNKFLTALGELLEGTKAEAAKELATLVNPADRAKAAADEADAAEKLLKTEEDARIAVQEAEANLAKGGEKAVLEAKLAAAKRALARAVNARKAAGLAQP